jgi:hypothetical protein
MGIETERIFADELVPQIGEAQTGHAGHAADDPDMERGKSS